MKLEKDIAEVRDELHKLIELRDTLSELIIKVSQILDRLILEYTHSQMKGDD